MSVTESINKPKNNEKSNTKILDLIGKPFFGVPVIENIEELSNYPKASLILYLYLYSYFCRTGKDKVIFNLIDLEEKTKYSKNTLKNAIKGLKDSGVIFIRELKGDYIFLIPKPSNETYLQKLDNGEISPKVILPEEQSYPQKLTSFVKESVKNIAKFCQKSDEKNQKAGKKNQFTDEKNQKADGKNQFTDGIYQQIDFNEVPVIIENKDFQRIEKSLLDPYILDPYIIDHHHIEAKSDDAFFQKESNKEEEGIDLNDEESLNRILNEAISSLDDSVGKDYKKSSALPVNSLEQKKELTSLIKNFDFEGIPYAIHQNKLNELLDTYPADLIKKQFNYMLSRQNPKTGKSIANPVGFFLDSLKNYDSYSTSSSKAQAEKKVSLDKEKNKEGLKKLARVFGVTPLATPWIIFGEIFVYLRGRLEYFTKNGKDDLSNKKQVKELLVKIPDLVDIDYFRSGLSDSSLYDSLLSILNKEEVLC